MHFFDEASRSKDWRIPHRLRKVNATSREKADSTSSAPFALRAPVRKTGYSYAASPKTNGRSERHGTSRSLRPSLDFPEDGREAGDEVARWQRGRCPRPRRTVDRPRFVQRSLAHRPASAD